MATFYEGKPVATVPPTGEAGLPEFETELGVIRCIEWGDEDGPAELRVEVIGPDDLGVGSLFRTLGEENVREPTAEEEALVRASRLFSAGPRTFP